ncbi:E3 ubiquitin-protein ligase MARCHF3 [Brachyhypopomus gauderio]|uniref:E3 ubiquitin-protein ligase MARCHF3 n=1 Tax=Brachyhypopomus gauderio TaxID=698409 RepID=UPI0040421703
MPPCRAAMLGEELFPGPAACPVQLVSVHTPCVHQETSITAVQDTISCSALVSSILPGPSCSSLNWEEPLCRICHEGQSAGDLLSPCQCAGSLRTVHRACLERWLSASHASRCELCHFEFALEYLPKPLTEWLTAPAMQHQRRALCGDALCFLIITPLASLSGWLCVQGAMDLYYNSSTEAFGLLVLTLALFIIYLFWTLVSLHYHVHLFRVWRASEPRVRLHVAPSEHTPRPHPSTPPFLDTAKTKDAVV